MCTHILPYNGQNKDKRYGNIILYETSWSVILTINTDVSQIRIFPQHLFWPVDGRMVLRVLGQSALAVNGCIHLDFISKQGSCESYHYNSWHLPSGNRPPMAVLQKLLLAPNFSSSGHPIAFILSTRKMFFKVGQARPLFVYFRSFQAQFLHKN